MSWIDSFNCVDLTLYSCTLYIIIQCYPFYPWVNFTQKENIIYLVLLITINNVMYICVHYCMYICYVHPIEWMEHFLLFRVWFVRSLTSFAASVSVIGERTRVANDRHRGSEQSQRTNERGSRLVRSWLLPPPRIVCWDAGGASQPLSGSASANWTSERTNERITLVNWTRWTNEWKWIIMSHH